VQLVHLEVQYSIQSTELRTSALALYRTGAQLLHSLSLCTTLRPTTQFREQITEMELIQRTITTLQEGHFRQKAQHEEEVTRLRTQLTRSTSDGSNSGGHSAAVVPARSVPPRSTLPLEGGPSGGRDYGNSGSGSGGNDNTNSNWQPPHELAAQHMRGSAAGSNSGSMQMPPMQLQPMSSNTNNTAVSSSGGTSGNSGQPAAKRSRGEDYSHLNADADRGGMGMRDDRGGILPSSNYGNSNSSTQRLPGAASSGSYRSEQHDDFHHVDRRDGSSSGSRGLQQQQQQQSEMLHRSSNSSHDRPRSSSANIVSSSSNNSSNNSSSRPTAAPISALAAAAADDDMIQPQSPQQQQQQQHAAQQTSATPPHELVRHTPAPRPPFVTPAWTLEYVGGRDGLRPTVDLAACLSLGSVVCCVRFSRDGTRIATGSHGCVKVFDVATGIEVFEHKKALSAADADAVS
jgi:general transcriptional corepressor TUP1